MSSAPRRCVLSLLVHVGARAVPDDGLLNMLFDLTRRRRGSSRRWPGARACRSYARALASSRAPSEAS